MTTPQSKTPSCKYPSLGQNKTSTTPSSGGSGGQSSKKQNLFEKKLIPPFEEYWIKERVSEGLKRGELVKGKVRINQRNYEEAFIDDPEFGRDYFIQGLQSRNRAFHDDLVAVEVLPLDKWIPIDDFQKLQSGLDAEPDGRYLPDEKEEMTQPQLATVKDLSAATVECKETLIDSYKLLSQPSSLLELLEVLFNIFHTVRLYRTKSNKEPAKEEVDLVQKKAEPFIKTVKVVYIIERCHSRACAGFLKAFDKATGQALLCPNDSKVPRVMIPLRDCPENYCQNPKQYQSTLFICKINQWSVESPFASGNLMRSLGEAGEIEPETESFLLENDVDYLDFSQEVLDCLPKNLPWFIPEEEVLKRKDFRSECVFSIDPATARDLDDALHIKFIDNGALFGVYEVGVHISDVSYFVHPGTPLDVAASKRATSIYLVQRVIPMLPRLLCEQLCSLNPNEDRLTFSVVWTLSINGEFISEWMGRTMIRSCVKLTYDHAQLMIDDPVRIWQDGDIPLITGGFQVSDVSKSVNLLNQLAKALKKQREKMGTLRLNQPRLEFSLNKQTGLPNGCSVYQHKESHSLIEEFMLLANMAVARQIHKSYPEKALLRRHPPPKKESLKRLESTCTVLGVNLDAKTAQSLQASLDHYSHPGMSQESASMAQQILLTCCLKVMELARYFCAGTVAEDAFLHYALNVSHYTHFTSPIRRYADLVVHRQLAAALGEGPPFTKMIEEIEEQASLCNKKKKSAKIVQDLSTSLFLCLFLRECGPLRAKGMVQQILDKSFDVLVLDLGIVKRVYCEKLPLEKYFYEVGGAQQLSSLHLIWDTKEDQEQILTVFSRVAVELFTNKESSLQIEARILRPMHPTP